MPSSLLDKLRLSPRRELPPPGALRTFFLGIFFTFSPIGSLLAMVLGHPWTWVMGLASILVSGTIALGWATAFMIGRLWLLGPVIVGQIILPPLIFAALARSGAGQWGSGMGSQSRLLFHATTALVCLVIGFVLLSKFIRSEQTRTIRYRTEVDMAQRIHQRLVPPLGFSTRSLDVLGRSLPSSEMGGDLIDSLQRDTETDVFVADVSGHGVGAGIVMGMVKSAIRMRLRSDASLESLLTDLNVVITDLTDSNMFATFACVRAGDRGEINYALAGHLPILLHRAATNELIELPNEHLPLGIEPGESFRSGRTPFHPGDTLLMFTDGLIEVQNAAGHELGLAAFTAAFAANAARPLPEILDTLLALARAHGTPLDDQSLLVMRRRPN